MGTLRHRAWGLAGAVLVLAAAGCGGGSPDAPFGGRPLAPETTIPVTRIRVPLLMGDGGQDPIWDADAAASTIMAELHGSPGHPPATNLYYPGAGHYYFGFPPYSPFFTAAELGGSEQANALATEQFWTRMITFLRHLAIHPPPAAGPSPEP